MATKKKTAFSGPTIGTKYPKGSTIKRNADGTITIVPPKKNSKKGK